MKIEKLNSFQAALKLAILTDDHKRDWPSFLLENRRNAITPSSLKDGFSRGNTAKWGRLPYYRGEDNKVYYIHNEVEDFAIKNAQKVVDDERRVKVKK